MREVTEFLTQRRRDAEAAEEMEVIFCCFSVRDKWFYEQVLEELK